MGARIFVVSAGLSLMAAAFVVQACGEAETSTTTATTDAGPDVVDRAPLQDASPSNANDAATCDLAGDFSERIPDAAIADGASTSGLCVQCANSQCSKEVAACNGDCPCQGLAASALDCYLKNAANAQICAAGFIGSGVSQTTRGVGITLLSCINSRCKGSCAVESFQQDAGKDADAS